MGESRGSIDEMALVIGHEATMMLVNTYGGQCLYIPKNDKEAIHVRNKAVVEASAMDVKHSDIARRYGISVRTVARIIAVHKQFPRLGQEAAP